MISKYKYEKILILIALIWLFVFSNVLQLNPTPSYKGDEGTYYKAAKNIYFNFKIDDARPLFISLINGFPSLFGFSLLKIFMWSFIVNTLCWITSTLLIFKIAISRTTIKRSFIASLFFILCIGNLAVNFKLLSESVFIFLLIFALYSVNNFLLSKKIHYLSIALCTLIMSILVKPMAIGITVLFTLFTIKLQLKIFFNKYSILIYISLILLFFQMFSLKKMYGNFTVSYIDSFTYYNYLGSRAECIKENKEYIFGKYKRDLDFNKLSNYEQKKRAYKDFKEQLSDNKINLLKAYFINIYINSTKGSTVVHGCKNYSKNSYFKFFQYLFKVISKVQNIFLTIAGVITSLFCIVQLRKNDIFNLIISVLVLYVFLTSGISCDQGDRFHIVFFPFVILLLINKLNNLAYIRLINFKKLLLNFSYLSL